MDKLINVTTYAKIDRHKLLQLSRVFDTPELECIFIDPKAKLAEFVERGPGELADKMRPMENRIKIDLNGLLDMAAKSSSPIGFDVFICLPYMASTLLLNAATQLPGTSGYAECNLALYMAYDLNAPDTKDLDWPPLLELAARLISRTDKKENKPIVKDFASNAKVFFEMSKRWKQIRAVFVLGEFADFYAQVWREDYRHTYVERRLQQAGFWSPEAAAFATREVSKMSGDERLAAYWYLSKHSCASWPADSKSAAYLDVESFLNRPAESLDAIGRFLGRDWKTEEIERVVNGPVFAKHAKTSAKYELKNRKREINDSLAAHKEGYEKGLAYIEKLEKLFPIAKPFPKMAKLID